MKKDIWKVSVRSGIYPGEFRAYLFAAKNAAQAEELALKKARGEIGLRSKPYCRYCEFLGPLDN